MSAADFVVLIGIAIAVFTLFYWHHNSKVNSRKMEKEEDI